jgi:hypothetical protein
VKDEHPFTLLIPERADQDELVMDIAQSGGVREPVYLYEDKVIEGRVRYRALREIGLAPQFKDWVLLDEGGDPLDWMVRRHVETHELNELDLIRLTAAVLPYYREMPGQTERLLYNALGKKLSWNKIRTADWLQEVGALEPVLRGEKQLLDAARSAGFATDKKGVTLGQNYGSGDKFDEAIQPIKRYLAAWKRKGYEFRHLNPKEAARRLSLIDSVREELDAARPDLQRRSKEATLSLPPERKR